MPRRVALSLAVLLVAALLPAAVAGAEGVRVASDEVAAMARTWLVQYLGRGAENATIEVAAPPRELSLPAGRVAYDFTLQAGSMATGAMTVLVEAAVVDPRGTRLERSVTVNFRINAQREVVVALRELPRRAIVGEADVRVETRRAERLPPGAARDLRDVLGKEVVRPLAPGEPLTAAALSTPRVVRRGAPVTLLLDGQGFRIVAKGLAQEDGAVGESIRVLNRASRKELVGRVEDDGTVRVAH